MGQTKSCDHGHHHHGHHHHGHHHHGHHHHHHHGHQSVSRLKLAFWLNLGFCVVEFVAGVLSNSVAVLSDALHDFGDAMALGMAVYLEKKSWNQSDAQYSYGYRRLSLMAALFMGLLLTIGSVVMIGLAIERWLNPEPIKFEIMIGIAVLGLLVNGFAAYRVSKGQSLNERMAFLHLLEDAGGWVLVFFGGILGQWTGWVWIDSALAITLSLWILFHLYSRLKATLSVFLQGLPPGVQMDDVLNSVTKIPMVSDIHHAHIWSLDGESHIFTAHVVVPSTASAFEIQELKNKIKVQLKNFGIIEATLEFEWASETCADPHHQVKVEGHDHG